MKRLVSEGSKDKPVIDFNNESGILFIGGSSLPENVLDVYMPVLEWLEEYIYNPNPSTTVEFFFEYLNTASSHMIMRLLKKCLEFKAVCNELKINWYYIAGDLDMRDFGLELLELTDFPINIISKDTHI